MTPLIPSINFLKFPFNFSYTYFTLSNPLPHYLITTTKILLISSISLIHRQLSPKLSLLLLKEVPSINKNSLPHLITLLTFFLSKFYIITHSPSNISTHSTFFFICHSKIHYLNPFSPSLISIPLIPTLILIDAPISPSNISSPPSIIITHSNNLYNSHVSSIS